MDFYIVASHVFNIHECVIFYYKIEISTIANDLFYASSLFFLICFYPTGSRAGQSFPTASTKSNSGGWLHVYNSFAVRDRPTVLQYGRRNTPVTQDG